MWNLGGASEISNADDFLYEYISISIIMNGPIWTIFDMKGGIDNRNKI